MACVGFSVGLGNVWRFPYLCYKYGGGAFLIPYFIAVIFGGIPLFFLEVCLGQYMSRGGIEAWNVVPLMKGIGFASAIIVFFLDCYYNVILSWAFYYLFASFTFKLPWSHCSNIWNSVNNCTVIGENNFNQTNTTGQVGQVDSAAEFWEYKVLDISEGIDHVGTVKWDLCLCLLLAWLVVYLCIIKGIKSSGKVMYITATSPYFFMLALLIRVALLEGAKGGLHYYLVPNFHKLNNIEVWINAATQVFFSYSISLGTLTALGSYNEYNHNVLGDAILFAAINSFTSFFAGLVIFMTLGYMSHVTDVPIDKVAEAGPGLAFVVYPKALAKMPIAPMWSVFFFLMIILLGLDSQFVGVEGLVTAIADMFPKFMASRFRRALFTLSVCVVCFSVGLTMITNGGIYVFQLFDYYSGSRIILLVAFFECITISYFYGVNRFIQDISRMTTFPLKYVFRVFWVALTPLYVLTIFLLEVITADKLSYHRGTKDKDTNYYFPTYAVIIGWLIASSSITMVPVYAIYRIATGSGTFKERVDVLLQPVLPSDHPSLLPDEPNNSGKKTETLSTEIKPEAMTK